MPKGPRPRSSSSIGVGGGERALDGAGVERRRIASKVERPLALTDAEGEDAELAPGLEVGAEERGGDVATERHAVRFAIEVPGREPSPNGEPRGPLLAPPAERLKLDSRRASRAVPGGRLPPHWGSGSAPRW